MTTRALYLAGLGAFGLYLGTAMPALADNNHGHGCNERTLKGTYIWNQDGFENRRLVVATTPTTPVPADRRPFSYAGREKYDGRGNVEGINTLAQARGATTTTAPDGDPDNEPVNVAPFVGYVGTYEVNPDCTAVVTTTEDPEGDPVFVTKYHLFLSPDGDQFTFVIFSSSVGRSGVFFENAQELTSSGVAYRVSR
jgi:hypothetical protein